MITNLIIILPHLQWSLRFERSNRLEKRHQSEGIPRLNNLRGSSEQIDSHRSRSVTRQPTQYPASVHFRDIDQRSYRRDSPAQNIAGHASTATTINLYGHVILQIVEGVIASHLREMQHSWVYAAVWSHFCSQSGSRLRQSNANL